MGNKVLTTLRVLVIVTLILLVVQYELGMAINLGPTLPKLPAIAVTSTQFTEYLNRAGVTTVIHATLGSLLALVGLANLVVAQYSKKTSVRILGVLTFLTTLLAAGLGSSYVASGYQNDGLSQGMAANFILTFTFYFIELYVLRPETHQQAA